MASQGMWCDMVVEYVTFIACLSTSLESCDDDQVKPVWSHDHTQQGLLYLCVPD